MAPSAQARHTLQDAFERFASTVTPDDRRLFHNTQLEDVRDEAIRIERQLRARRMQKNMARLDPFLQGMEHYSKIVEVLCNGTPYLPWIWAPVKLMLMITADSISAFEKLIEAYGKIGDMLPRLDRLSNALGDDHNFQNVLALVYSDIVEFHRRAYKFVRRNSWAIFFSSMWAGFEFRFDGILKNLAYHSELADKEAAAADIAEAVQRSKVDDEKWEQQEREWNAVKIQNVLAWLGTNDTLPADLLERHIRGYLPGSCDWFTQHQATQLWLGDSAKNPLLWLCGKPGAGKSMICSTLVQHAEANAFHVFYYFCSFLGSHSNGPNRLLRSIISQVIQKHQDLAIYVHDIYFKSHPVPTKKALLCLLPELLRGLGSVRLVVDGIDEWVSQDQKELLNDLSQMISTGQSSHICKIMIASRDTMDISRSLRKKNKSAMTVSLSNDDERFALTRSIANFVNSKLSDLPDHFDELDPDGSIMVYVRKTLLEKSHGMFLWVSLVLDSLNTVYSPEELRTIVDDLPSDLEALYEQIVIRLCSAPGAQSHGGVSRVMSWICFARRPLHKSELLQALSISPHDMGSQVRSIPVASILDHCKPLIEELPDSTVVPVHFSVTEYFLTSQIPQIVPAIDAALDMSSACVVVIMRGLELVRLENNSMDGLARIASGNYRLLPYAIEFWIEHCSQYASRGGSLGLDRPLQHHLARMHEKHKNCLHALGRASTRAGTQDRTKASHTDRRLELFSNMSIYGLMADVLSLRQLVSQLDGDNSSDIEAYLIKNDQTLFSELAHKYESAIVHLLAQHEVEGIAPATLQAFQQSYASTAFRCRFPNCDRLSLGFATAELRLEHEVVHVQRLYCQTASCQYSRIGFGKRSALNTHTRKHHDQSNTLLIPAKIRRTTDAEAETGAKEHDLQTIDAEAQQLPVQTTQPHQGSLRPQSTEGSDPGLSWPAPQSIFSRMIPQQRLIIAQNLLREKPEIVELSDNTPFPPNIFEANLLRNVTPDVKTWVQLKAWVQQNPTLVPGVNLQTLQVMQILHYKDTVEDAKAPSPPPVETDVEPSKDPLFEGTPTTGNAQESDFDFDAIFGDAINTPGDNPHTEQQQRGSEMNNQGFDANVSAKQLNETRSLDPAKAYGQTRDSEWADEADVQSHRRAPSEAYSDISSVHAAPSIQPQDSLEYRPYNLSWPEGSLGTYDSLNTPSNGLWDNDSSASWFAPPADVQLFQDPNPQPDHSNVADNKAQLSPDYNAMNRTMAPATDSSSQSLHQQMSGHPARGQTMTQWWKSRKDAQKKSRENASKITTFR